MAMTKTDDSSSSSESTNEVFFKMLGLPVIDVGDISLAVEDDQQNQIICSPVVAAGNDRTISPPRAVICNSTSSAFARETDQPTVTYLQVPQKCSRYLHKPSTVAAFVVNNLITPSECQVLIQLAEKFSATGFHYVTEASHVDNEGIMHKVKLQEPNKHKLSVFEHDATLATLWDKLKPVISPHVDQFIKDTKSGLPLGLNPRLRVLRYDATDNDVFDPHFDATTRVTAKENADDLTSLLTVLIYLNDGGGKDFDGGETYFLDSTNPNSEPTKVVPSAGSVVVFEHDLYHSSVPLKYGTKFVLRTDVLFKLDEEAGVDKARKSDNDSNQKHGNALTLFELCEELQVDEGTKTCLSDIGLIDLTLESLIAPGMTAVKQMLFDVLDKDVATLIVDALTLHCLQN